MGATDVNCLLSVKLTLHGVEVCNWSTDISRDAMGISVCDSTSSYSKVL